MLRSRQQQQPKQQHVMSPTMVWTMIPQTVNMNSSKVTTCTYVVVVLEVVVLVVAVVVNVPVVVVTVEGESTSHVVTVGGPL
mmetsp:Transcript_58396/g.171357  ORF Transcript_58396/g.171357 Transcript_58396/m.171357 type:complete len:82 (-) Transcript_58396:246-491(-)